MAEEIWLSYLLTLLAFMITPGPSHLLMLSNSMAHGFTSSLATAAGDLTANVLQMSAAALGLAAILLASQNALAVVKWIGVAYLVWMGIRMWRNASNASGKKHAAESPSARTLWLQGFLTSAANPKAVVFFAALFPQFIDPSQPFLTQFVILSLTYLLVDGAFLVSYGASSSWIAKKLQGNSAIFINRIGSLFLIGAAIMLSVKSLQKNL